MTQEFPTIDATPLLDPTSSSAQRTKTAREIDVACTTIGFFAVTGHGVPDQVIADLYTASYGFFDLPADQKLRVRRPRPEQNRGYIPPGDETLARLAGRETPPDRKNSSPSDRSTCRMSRISPARPPIPTSPRTCGRTALIGSVAASRASSLSSREA